MKLKYIVIIVLALIATAGIAYSFAYEKQTGTQVKKPTSTSESSFLLNEMGYECSRKIDGRWVEAHVGNPGSAGYYFQPTNQEDLQKYCRTTYIIEYEAVLDILRKDDVRQIIEKYSTTEAWVRALGHKYIHDKDYLGRILPAYHNMKIDCIIVVHSPEGTRFFIENGDLHNSHADHQYLEIPAAEFLTSLNRAADTDITNFWLGLH